MGWVGMTRGNKHFLMHIVYIVECAKIIIVVNDIKEVWKGHCTELNTSVAEIEIILTFSIFFSFSSKSSTSPPNCMLWHW